MTWQVQAPPADHPAVQSGKVGVLLVNLGTPDEAHPKAVKRYLGEFLSDPRVIEVPQVVWQVILRGVILNVRPKKSAEAYSKVWTEHGSPLAAITREKALRLGERLRDDGVRVEYAMRYGNPSIASRLTAMKDDGYERILLAPMYPQYCAATTRRLWTRLRTRCGQCVGSPPCGPCRPITMIRRISQRRRMTSRGNWPPCRSSPRCCC
jgi:ferrochelatase